MNPLTKFLRDRRGQAISVMAIVVACISQVHAICEQKTVGVGGAVGLAVLAQTEDVFWNMELTSNANSAFDDTVGTIYDAWPLMGLIVLALIAAAILMAIAIIR